MCNCPCSRSARLRPFDQDADGGKESRFLLYPAYQGHACLLTPTGLRPSAVAWCLFAHEERIGNSLDGEGRSKKTKADFTTENTYIHKYEMRNVRSSVFKFRCRVRGKTNALCNFICLSCCLHAMTASLQCLTSARLFPPISDVNPCSTGAKWPKRASLTAIPNHTFPAAPAAARKFNRTNAGSNKSSNQTVSRNNASPRFIVT